MTDPRLLWDFDDPVGSEARLREAADVTEGEERGVLLTQVARALGLQDRFDEGHRELDRLADPSPEVEVRIALERGRLLRSAGAVSDALPYFGDAARLADAARLEELRVDALHMVALAVPPAEQLAAQQVALDAALAATDPRARDWDASILNNIGMTQADAGGHAAALVSFEEALAARERIGDLGRIRVARWMVAWSLRHLGRREEALALQRALKAELDAAGEHDPYVDEEIALLER